MLSFITGATPAGLSVTTLITGKTTPHHRDIACHRNNTCHRHNTCYRENNSHTLGQQGHLQQVFASTHLYNWVKRDKVPQSFLSKKTFARARLELPDPENFLSINRSATTPPHRPGLKSRSHSTGQEYRSLLHHNNQTTQQGCHWLSEIMHFPRLLS